jgi:hypothetical protein
MTVAELIEILKNQDQDAVVCSYGHNCAYKEFYSFDITVKQVSGLAGENRVMIYCDLP